MIFQIPSVKLIFLFLLVSLQILFCYRTLRKQKSEQQSLQRSAVTALTWSEIHNSGTSVVNSSLFPSLTCFFVVAWAAFQHSIPRKLCCLEFLWPNCRTWHLVTLNTLTLALARSLWRAFLPSSKSTLSPPLVSSANWLRVCLIPPTQIIDKNIKQDWPQYRALRNYTCEQSLFGLYFIHLQFLAQPSIFFTQPRVHLSKSWAVSFSRRSLWEALSKALLKPRKATSIVFSLPIRQVSVS